MELFPLGRTSICKEVFVRIIVFIVDNLMLMTFVVEEQTSIAVA